MHLTFPNRNDSFTREELKCLSAVLGFQEEIFTKHVPLTTKNHTFVETKVIVELIERKVFNSDLHRTYNLYDGVYNAKVLQKALHVLSNRIISFADLKDVRIAFQFYECRDLSGLENNARIILRTLKMCGRVISPRKLIDHVKYIARTVPDRIMLYEFMELIPLCEKEREVKKKIDARTVIKNRKYSTVSEIADFEDILIQDDKKEFDYLDDIYEQSFFRPSFVSKPSWRVESQDAVNKDWKNHVSSHQQVAFGLDATLRRSNKKVVRARNGTGNQQVQFIDFNILNDKRKRAEITTASREVEVGAEKSKEVLHFWDTDNTVNETSCGITIPPLSPSTRRLPPSLISGTDRQQCWSDPPKYLTKKSKLTDEVLVSKQAVHDTHTKIVNLLWDLEMKDELSKSNVKEQKLHVSQLPSEENTVISGSSRQFEEKEESSGPQDLPTRTPSPQLDSKSSDIYSFLNSRIKQRDSLLGRCFTSCDRRPSAQSIKTMVSGTEKGRSRKSRNAVRVESATA